MVPGNSLIVFFHGFLITRGVNLNLTGGIKMNKTYMLPVVAIVAILALTMSVSAATVVSATYTGINGRSVTITQISGSNSYGSATNYNVRTSNGGNYNLWAGELANGASAAAVYGRAPLGSIGAVGAGQANGASAVGGIGQSFNGQAGAFTATQIPYNGNVYHSHWYSHN